MEVLIMIQYLDGGEIASYDGYSFRKDKITGYYLSSKKIGTRRKRLHVYVWEKQNGKVPRGYHVHHVDCNKDNNEIENLALVTSKEHARIHGIEASEETLRKKRETWV